MIPVVLAALVAAEALVATPRPRAQAVTGRGAVAFAEMDEGSDAGPVERAPQASLADMKEARQGGKEMFISDMNDLFGGNNAQEKHDMGKAEADYGQGGMTDEQLAEAKADGGNRPTIAKAMVAVSVQEEQPAWLTPQGQLIQPQGAFHRRRYFAQGGKSDDKEASTGADMSSTLWLAMNDDKKVEAMEGMQRDYGDYMIEDLASRLENNPSWIDIAELHKLLTDVEAADAKVQPERYSNLIITMQSFLDALMVELNGVADRVLNSTETSEARHSAYEKWIVKSGLEVTAQFYREIHPQEAKIKEMDSTNRGALAIEKDDFNRAVAAKQDSTVELADEITEDISNEIKVPRKNWIDNKRQLAKDGREMMKQMVSQGKLKRRVEGAANRVNTLVANEKSSMTATVGKMVTKVAARIDQIKSKATKMVNNVEKAGDRNSKELKKVIYAEFEAQTLDTENVIGQYKKEYKRVHKDIEDIYTGAGSMRHDLVTREADQAIQQEASDKELLGPNLDGKGGYSKDLPAKVTADLAAYDEEAKEQELYISENKVRKIADVDGMVVGMNKQLTEDRKDRVSKERMRWDTMEAKNMESMEQLEKAFNGTDGDVTDMLAATADREAKILKEGEIDNWHESAFAAQLKTEKDEFGAQMTINLNNIILNGEELTKTINEMYTGLPVTLSSSWEDVQGIHIKITKAVNDVRALLTTSFKAENMLLETYGTDKTELQEKELKTVVATAKQAIEEARDGVSTLTDSMHALMDEPNGQISQVRTGPDGIDVKTADAQSELDGSKHLIYQKLIDFAGSIRASIDKVETGLVEGLDDKVSDVTEESTRVSARLAEQLKKADDLVVLTVKPAQQQEEETGYARANGAVQAANDHYGEWGADAREQLGALERTEKSAAELQDHIKTKTKQVMGQATSLATEMKKTADLEIPPEATKYEPDVREKERGNQDALVDVVDTSAVDVDEDMGNVEDTNEKAAKVFNALEQKTKVANSKFDEIKRVSSSIINKLWSDLSGLGTELSLDNVMEEKASGLWEKKLDDRADYLNSQITTAMASGSGDLARQMNTAVTNSHDQMKKIMREMGAEEADQKVRLEGEDSRLRTELKGIYNRNAALTQDVGSYSSDMKNGGLGVADEMGKAFNALEATGAAEHSGLQDQGKEQMNVMTGGASAAEVAIQVINSLKSQLKELNGRMDSSYKQKQGHILENLAHDHAKSQGMVKGVQDQTRDLLNAQTDAVARLKKGSKNIAYEYFDTRKKSQQDMGVLEGHLDDEARQTEKSAGVLQARVEGGVTDISHMMADMLPGIEGVVHEAEMSEHQRAVKHANFESDLLRTSELESEHSEEDASAVQDDVRLEGLEEDRRNMWTMRFKAKDQVWKHTVADKLKELGLELDQETMDTLSAMHATSSKTEAMGGQARAGAAKATAIEEHAQQQVLELHQQADADIARLLADTSLSEEERQAQIAKIRQDVASQASAIFAKQTQTVVEQQKLAKALENYHEMVDAAKEATEKAIALGQLSPEAVGIHHQLGEISNDIKSLHNQNWLTQQPSSILEVGAEGQLRSATAQTLAHTNVELKGENAELAAEISQLEQRMAL